MGMSLSKVFANLFGKKEMRILMVGLDGMRCAWGGLWVVMCLFFFLREGLGCGGHRSCASGGRCFTSSLVCGRDEWPACGGLWAAHAFALAGEERAKWSGRLLGRRLTMRWVSCALQLRGLL